jgi:prephenate dehydratase
VKIVYATTALHNFISLFEEEDFDVSEIEEEPSNENLSKDFFVVKENKKMQKKDKIAQ